MTSNLRKCLLLQRNQFFLRKNKFLEELQLENTSSNVLGFLQMNSAWYIFKTHTRDFESYLKVLRNLQNKICMIVETRYFPFSNYLKNDKKCWKLQARVFNVCQVLFIHEKWDTFSDVSLRLVKRPGLFVKINVSVKKCDFEFFSFFLLWYRIYKNWTIVTCFFYKLNVYKHVQPEISGRNKHMLNILASLETASLLFSCLKSKTCNGKICICFYSITNIIVFGNNHRKVVLENSCF